MSRDDAEIRRLETQVAMLTAEIARLQGLINGRQPLAALRDERGNVNLRDWGGKAPTGYALLNGPHVADAASRLGVPSAPAVRYQKRGEHWQTVAGGLIVPQEQAAEVGALADRLEARR